MQTLGHGSWGSFAVKAKALGWRGFVKAIGFWAAIAPVLADETCMSPYMPKITGQEEFVYVWTLGNEGWGDGSDKLVTIDVKLASPNYEKVLDSSSMGGRHSRITAGLRTIGAICG